MSDAEAASGLGEIVGDRLLDGRLSLRQPAKGHRAGSDAVLLAAALPELSQGILIDLGAGVGTVGLAAALAQPALRVVLVERDAELAALAGANAADNAMADRVAVVCADLTASASHLASAGLTAGMADCVAMNPPFFTRHEAKASPVANRRAAHVIETGLDDWIKAARRLLKPRGDLVVIHRAEALPELLAALATGFGALAIRPVHARIDRPAIRILVHATLGSKKPAALLPAFVLNGPDGRFTPESEALHRGRLRLAAQ